MIVRIHHVRNGIEYVLQYNSKTDTIESRENRLILIGGVPNYFRDNGLGTALEAHTFKITLRNWRPSLCFSEALNRLPAPLNRLPMLSDEEKDLIHEFEKIADINLCLTPESVSRHRVSEMQEIARLPGIDISSPLRYTRLFCDNFANANEQTSTEEESVQNAMPRMPEVLEEQLIHTPESLRAAHPDMNTEGMTEEEVQENLEFVARLLNGETIPATEFPSRDSGVDDDDIDKLLKKIDTTLNDENHQHDEVCGAPTHRLEIPAPVMSRLWRSAQGEDTY